MSHRRQNVDWGAAEADGSVPTWQRVNTIVLMDIRFELQRLNRLLHCSNFTDIPFKLNRIARNTTKPRQRRQRVRRRKAPIGARAA